jgi:hypothetical protein
MEIRRREGNELASYLRNADDCDEAWSVSQGYVRGLDCCELSSGGSGVFAALICVARRKTFTLRATIRRLRGHDACKAVERSNQQEDRQQCEADVDRSTHLWISLSNPGACFLPRGKGRCRPGGWERPRNLKA